MLLTAKEWREITRTVSEQHGRATKKQRGPILDQVVASTGYSRRYPRFVLRNHRRRAEVRPGIVLEGDRRVARRFRPAPRYESQTAWDGAQVALLRCLALRPGRQDPTPLQRYEPGQKRNHV